MQKIAKKPSIEELSADLAARNAAVPGDDERHKTYVGKALEGASVAGAAGTLGAFAHMGGTRTFDPNAKPKVLLIGGKEEFSRKPRPMDSFSAQSQAMVRGLREAGVDVQYKPLAAHPGKLLAHLLDVPTHDALIVAGHPHGYPRYVGGAGKVRYRQNSDFGDGNNVNSKDIYRAGMAGQDSMAVREPHKWYTRNLVPGTEDTPLKSKYKGRRESVMIGNIPVSPAFEGATYSPKDWSPTARKKAFITIGGGNAAPMVFDDIGSDTLHMKHRSSQPRRVTGKLGLSGTGRSYKYKEKFWLDDLVQALNTKHKEGIDIELLLGTGKVQKGERKGLYSGDGQWGKIPNLYDDFSHYLQTPEGQTRFPGLKLIDRLPQAADKPGGPSMAGAYSDAHYNFLVPGSTSAEAMAIGGGTPGKTVVMMPNDRPKLFMKHFPQNLAEMQRSGLPNVHRWDMHDKAGRMAQLQAILDAEVQSAPGRQGYKTDFSKLKEVIKADVKKQKMKNIKTLAMMGGVSMATGVLGKVVALVESYRNRGIDREQALRQPQIKQASTALTRYMLRKLESGVPAHRLLAKKDVARLTAAKIAPRERMVTRLGSGGSNHADLVFHPKFGPSVRRSPKRPTEDLPFAPDTKARKLLMKIQKKRKNTGFAKILDVEPSGISFSEVVPNRPTKNFVKLQNKVKELQAAQRQIRVDAKAGLGPNEVAARKAALAKKIQKYQFLHHLEKRKRQVLKPSTVKTVNELKQYFPDMYDYNGAHNNMSGKIVDFSTVRNKNKGGYSTSKDPNRDKYQIFRDRAAGKYTTPVQLPDKVPDGKKPLLAGLGIGAGVAGAGYLGYKALNGDEEGQEKQANALSRYLQRRLESGVPVKKLISRQDTQKLTANRMFPKERMVKRLGSGANQNADLVFHPEHGMVVRKSPTKPTEDLHEAVDTKALVLLKKIQTRLKSGGGVAKMHEVDPSGISYWEYVQPKTNRHWENLKARRDLHRSQMEELEQLVAKDPSNAKLKMKLRRAVARHSISKETEKIYGWRKTPISARSRKTMNKVKEHFPNVWDFDNHNNYVDGKVIDFNTHGGGYSTSKNPKRDVYEIFRERKAGKFTQPIPMPEKQAPNPNKTLRALAIGGAALGAGAAGYMGYKALQPDDKEPDLRKIAAGDDELIRETVDRQHSENVHRSAFSTKHIAINDASKKNINELYKQLPNKKHDNYVADSTLRGGVGWGVTGLLGHGLAKTFGKVSPKSSPWPTALATGTIGAIAHNITATRRREALNSVSAKHKRELIKRYLARNEAHDNTVGGKLNKDTTIATKMAVPAMIGTSVLGMAAQMGIPATVRNLKEISDKHLDELQYASKQEGKVHMLRPTDKKAPTIFHENAAYVPKSAVKMLKKNKSVSDSTKKKYLGDFKDNKPRIMATSKRMWKPGILAHELGHAQLHADKKSIAGWLQRKAYMPTKIVNTFGGGLIPTTATYMATKDDDSVLSGTAKGLGIGAGMNAGILVPEFEASRRGSKALIKTTLPKAQKISNIKSMILPFLTYGLAYAGPSAAVGGIHAYLNKRRKRHAAEEAAKQLK